MVADSMCVKRLLACLKNYALIMTVKQFNCFQRCSAYQTKTMMLSAISVLLLFFISICSASEIYILAIQQVNKSLIIGKYTDYTITSCVMRCKNNKKCAGIAFSELPTSKEKETFDCYLLQSKMVCEPEETLSQDASERNKMIGIQEVNKLGQEARNANNTVLVYEHCEQLCVKSNNRLATLPSLNKGYRVSFCVWFNKLPSDNEYYSTFELTTGTAPGKHGRRTPAIFINHKVGLHITSTVNGNWNEQHNILESIKENVWIKIEIRQERPVGSSDYVYSATINGKIVFSVVNTDPRDFNNVMVYAGNPWFGTADAKLKNIAIYTYLL